MVCTNHPQVEDGLEQCYFCGLDFCGDCVVTFLDRVVCADCKAEQVASYETGRAPVNVDADLAPWEMRHELGFFPSIVATVKAVMFEPARFYRRLETSRERWDCLGYGVLVNSVSLIFGYLVIMAFWAAWGGVFGGIEAGGMLAGIAAIQIVWNSIFIPIATLIGLFVFGGAIHLYLVVANANKRTYAQTVRGLCYAVSPMSLALIPIPYLGQLVGSIWTIVAAVHMVREIHQTTTGNAVIAVLWPIALVTCCCGGFFALMVAGVAAGSFPS